MCLTFLFIVLFKEGFGSISCLFGVQLFCQFLPRICWINGVSGSQLSAAAYYGDVLLAALRSIRLEIIKEISRIKVLRGDSN